ncbi:MAG: cytochrome c biogenesis protein CcdA [Sulfurovaceae bacterium]|nr:cytochrome c biogenesis protein CcdA [Sulfurovaceae bacterium]
MEGFLINAIEAHTTFAIFASFLVGVLTSIAPCSIITLPLLVSSALALSSDIEPKKKKQFILQYSFLFVFGLVVSFSILMLLVSKLGIMLSVAPLWAYILASLSVFLVAFYAMGFFGELDKQKIADKFLPLKLFGAIIIGIIFGLVSTPCATAPLVTIVSVASGSSWVYSYLLVLAFAIGHASLLLLSGISVGFAGGIAKSTILNKLSIWFNRIFIAILLAIGFYFAYKAYLII